MGWQSFNPRSRAGSDYRLFSTASQSPVSIHAPARGATCKLQLRNEMIDVSIHAPARGATSGGSGLRVLPEFQSTLPRGERHHIFTHRCYLYCFNPRSRAGSDYSPVLTETRGYTVSIHAPARGATLSVKIKPAKPASFNPRSRGSDITLLRHLGDRMSFNPRSRGSDFFFSSGRYER